MLQTTSIRFMRGANGGPAEPYASDKTALAKRNLRVRRLLERMRPKMPWIRDTDMPLLKMWAEHEILGAALFNRLVDAGRSMRPARLGSRCCSITASFVNHKLTSVSDLALARR